MYINEGDATPIGQGVLMRQAMDGQTRKQAHVDVCTMSCTCLTGQNWSVTDDAFHQAVLDALFPSPLMHRFRTERRIHPMRKRLAFVGMALVLITRVVELPQHPHPLVHCTAPQYLWLVHCIIV